MIRYNNIRNRTKELARAREAGKEGGGEGKDGGGEGEQGLGGGLGGEYQEDPAG